MRTEEEFLKLGLKKEMGFDFGTKSTSLMMMMMIPNIKKE